MGFVKEPLHVHGTASEGGLLETQLDVSSVDNVTSECKLPVAPARVLSISSGPRVIDRFSRLHHSTPHALANQNALSNLRQSGHLSGYHA